MERHEMYDNGIRETTAVTKLSISHKRLCTHSFGELPCHCINFHKTSIMSNESIVDESVTTNILFFASHSS